MAKTKITDDRSIRVRDDSENDLNAIQGIRDTWDEREALLVSKVTDSVSATTRSRVTDSRIATLAIESSARVMSQLPMGEVKALTKEDKGQAILMDMILHRHIIPNDDYMWDHLTKQRMQNFYSRLYGIMPMMYDWDERGSYSGPSSWLLQIRDYIPQEGRVSVKDCDYVHVDSYVSPRWLKDLVEKEDKKKDSKWNLSNIRKVLKQIDNNGAKPNAQEDNRKTSYVQRERDGANKKVNRVLLRTRYEVGKDGHWTTCAPEYDWAIFRDVENRHKNGKIPVVLKYNIPLIDSMYGLSDFERGKSLQFAMDSLTNLTLDSIKMKLYPPRIINPSGVVPSSLRYGPGKDWLETTPNSIRAYDSSPSSLNHFQSVYGFLSGALLNQFGTTDTAVNSEKALDPGFGKTPQALQMLQQRESVRDNLDRFYQEQGIEQLYNGFIDLMVHSSYEPMDIHLFGAEIQALEDLGYDNINKMLTKDRKKNANYAKLTIDKDELKDAEYRFYVEAGSTMKESESKQAESLVNLLTFTSKFPTLPQELQANGWKFDIGEAIRQVVIKSGVENPEQLIYRSAEDDQSPVEEAIDPMAQGLPPQGLPPQGLPPELAAQMQVATGAQPNQVNQGSVGAMQPQLATAQPVPEVDQVINSLLNR